MSSPLRTVFFRLFKQPGHHSDPHCRVQGEGPSSDSIYWSLSLLVSTLEGSSLGPFVPGHPDLGCLLTKSLDHQSHTLVVTWFGQLFCFPSPLVFLPVSQIVLFPTPFVFILSLSWYLFPNLSRISFAGLFCFVQDLSHHWKYHLLILHLHCSWKILCASDHIYPGGECLPAEKYGPKFYTLPWVQGGRDMFQGINIYINIKRYFSRN